MEVETKDLEKVLGYLCLVIPVGLGSLLLEMTAVGRLSYSLSLSSTASKTMALRPGIAIRRTLILEAPVPCQHLMKLGQP